jgi:hypothetical protein
MATGLPTTLRAVATLMRTAFLTSSIAIRCQPNSPKAIDGLDESAPPMDFFEQFARV